VVSTGLRTVASEECRAERSTHAHKVLTATHRRAPESAASLPIRFHEWPNDWTCRRKPFPTSLRGAQRPGKRGIAKSKRLVQAPVGPMGVESGIPAAPISMSWRSSTRATRHFTGQEAVFTLTDLAT
jgi:hypothetical protein